MRHFGVGPGGVDIIMIFLLSDTLLKAINSPKIYGIVILIVINQL